MTENGKSDIWTHRIAVIAVAAIALLSGGGMTLLAAIEVEIPKAISMLGATSVGALAVMLTKIMDRRT